METDQYESEDSMEETRTTVDENGLYCFLDKERPCSSECMAYTPDPVASPYLNGQQVNCTLVVGVERVGRYLGVLATIVKQSHDDHARRASPPPPDPRGGR